MVFLGFDDILLKRKKINDVIQSRIIHISCYSIMANQKQTMFFLFVLRLKNVLGIQMPEKQQKELLSHRYQSLWYFQTVVDHLFKLYAKRSNLTLPWWWLKYDLPSLYSPIESFMFIKSSGRAADFLADLHACFSRKTVDYSTDSEHSPKSRASSHSNFARTSSRMAEINMLWVDISPIYRISPFFQIQPSDCTQPLDQ